MIPTNRLALSDQVGATPHGLLVDMRVTQATGTAERDAALAMLDATKPNKRVTLGADAGYDVRSFARECRARGVTPHIAPH